MYDDLEEADSQAGDERPSSNNSRANSSRTNNNSHLSFSSFRRHISYNYFGEDDEVRSELATNLALHTIRSSDTRVPDEIFSISNPYEPTRGSVTGSSVRSGTHDQSQAGSRYQVQAKRRAFERRRYKRPRTDAHAAPAFNPIAPNKVELRPIGYHYQRPQNENGPARSWDVIDPQIQNITRARKSNENRQPSKKPHDPINTPMAGVFGSRDMQMAVDDNTVSTDENLDTLPTTLGRGNVGPPSGVAWSNNGSAPLGSSLRPSVRTIGSSHRPSQNDSVGSSFFDTESVDSDRTVGPSFMEIHHNIRANFVTRDEFLTHQAPRTMFERTNNDWAATRTEYNCSNVIVNRFGEGNVTMMESQSETRIMDWDENGYYKGAYRGAIKKRIRLGFIGAIKKLEAEMMEASQIYHELLQMRPEERLAALTAMRKPMTQWASGPGASFDDVFETEAIPGIYKKKWDAKKARRDRLDRILQAKAIPKSRANAGSQSGKSQQSHAPSSIGGHLGDLDGPLRSTRAHHSVSGTTLSSRNSFADVERMSERAVNTARSARSSEQRATSQRGSRPARSVVSSSTTTQRSGGVRIGNSSRSISRVAPGFRLEDGTWVYGPYDQRAEPDSLPDHSKIKLNGRGGMPWDRKWNPQADPEPCGGALFAVPADEAILRRPVPDLELLRKSGMQNGEGSEYIHSEKRSLVSGSRTRFNIESGSSMPLFDSFGVGSVGGGSSITRPPSTIHTTSMRYSVRNGEMVEREDNRHERSIMRTTAVSSLGLDRDTVVPRKIWQRVGTTAEGAPIRLSIGDEEQGASYSQPQPAGRQLTLTNVTQLEKETGQPQNIVELVRGKLRHADSDRSILSNDEWPALGAQHTKGTKPGDQHNSRATSLTSKQGRTDAASVRTDFAALLEYDDSPLLVDPSDVAFPSKYPIEGDLLRVQEVAMQRSKIRGRAVVVRLHSTVQFTGVAFAKRIFGGIVQEFQLHKDKRSAVVVFVHPAEAHSFLSHYTNVRELGTEQEIREFQIEVAWYNGREKGSIIPQQPNIMTYHVGLGATRALKIHNIHPTKLYKDVIDDLNSHFGEKMVMFMTLQSPIEHHKLAGDGRQAIVEFASLGDAINAYLDFSSGLMTGYEDARPKFMEERSAKQAQDKPFCNCLGCSERKSAYADKRAQKIMQLREQRDGRVSARGTASRSVVAEPPSVIGSSGACGPTNGSTSGVLGETTDIEGDLMEFSDDEGWGF